MAIILRSSAEEVHSVRMNESGVNSDERESGVSSDDEHAHGRQ